VVPVVSPVAVAALAVRVVGLVLKEHGKDRTLKDLRRVAATLTLAGPLRCHGPVGPGLTTLVPRAAAHLGLAGHGASQYHECAGPVPWCRNFA